jgi:hypothetical protein
MSTNDTYLAIFLGSKTSPKMMAWNSLPEAERRAKEREGIAAWRAWVEKHHGAIVAMGGPLGKTKKITQRGIQDVSNEMGAFTVVRAESNEARREAFRKPSALHDLPWRIRGGNAGLAHTWCLICSSRGTPAVFSKPTDSADVCFWPKADIWIAPRDVCYWG